MQMVTQVINVASMLAGNWGEAQSRSALAAHYWGDRSLEHQDGEPQERGMTRSHKKTENILRHSWAARPITLFQDHSDPSQCTFVNFLQLSAEGIIHPCTMGTIAQPRFCKPKKLWHDALALQVLAALFLYGSSSTSQPGQPRIFLVFFLRLMFLSQKTDLQKETSNLLTLA